MPAEERVVLVTGATGKQGGATASELLARGHRVRVMTRKPDGEAARELTRRGAEVVKGDLDDPASLEKPLAGAWGAFAVQNTWEAGVEREEEQGHRFAKAARAAGVRHFVYTSVGSADRRTGIPHFENKARVEETVRSAGFPSYTILRPVFFMENFASPWFLPALKDGKLAMALRPDTVLQMIAVSDVGKYALHAFEHPEEMNRAEVDLAGDQHTMPQTAEIIGNAMGRRVEFAPPPIEAVRQGSADFAAMLEWFDRVGYDVDIPGNERRYGIRPTSLKEWAARQNWG